MKKKIAVAIADDEKLFRKGMRFLIEKFDDFEVVFEAENGQEVIDQLSTLDGIPDIVLMDLKMPILNGVETTKILFREGYDIKIIALTSYIGKSFVTNMIRLGVSSYLTKNTNPRDLIYTIKRVYEKGFHYDLRLASVVRESLTSSKSKRKRVELDKNLLSQRELEVLELICCEYTTSEIAEKLFISPRTVDGHRNNLLLKTGSKNVAGLVIYGIQKKIVELSPDFKL